MQNAAKSNKMAKPGLINVFFYSLKLAFASFFGTINALNASTIAFICVSNVRLKKIKKKFDPSTIKM